MSNAEALLGVALPCIAFFLLHSLLVAGWFKSMALRALGPRVMSGWYRLLYTVVSIASLTVALWFITRIPDHHIYSFPRWIGWPMHALRLGGLLFGYISYRQLRSDEFTGTAQALRFLKGQEPGGDMEGLTGDKLIRDGGYALVRNPLYLAGIIIFIFQPEVTRTWLTVSVLSVGYFVWGALIEEKRMLRRYGEEYRDYMKEVPLLVPRPSDLTRWLRSIRG